MTTTKSITLPDLEELRQTKGAPLYKKYPNQSEPQPAYVYLHKNGTVTFGYNPEIGGAVSMDIWHGRTLRWTIPNDLSGFGLANVLETIAPLLERVHAGHTVEWDGNNMVGKLNEDADYASFSIALTFDEDVGERFHSVSIYGSFAWMHPACSFVNRNGALTSREEQMVLVRMDGDVIINDSTTEDEIQALAQRIEAEAEEENCVLVDPPIADLLREWRNTCHENASR